MRTYVAPLHHTVAAVFIRQTKVLPRNTWSDGYAYRCCSSSEPEVTYGALPVRCLIMVVNNNYWAWLPSATPVYCANATNCGLCSLAVRCISCCCLLMVDHTSLFHHLLRSHISTAEHHRPVVDAKQEARLMLRNLRDTISSGGRKIIGNWLAAVSYAEGVLTYRQAAWSYSTAIALSVIRPKIPPEWQAPLPVRISQPYAVLENHSGRATTPRKKFDVIFSRLDTIPACDIHPAVQSSFDNKDRAMHIYVCRAVKIWLAIAVVGCCDELARVYL